MNTTFNIFRLTMLLNGILAAFLACYLSLTGELLTAVIMLACCSISLFVFYGAGIHRREFLRSIGKETI